MHKPERRYMKETRGAWGYICKQTLLRIPKNLVCYTRFISCEKSSHTKICFRNRPSGDNLLYVKHFQTGQGRTPSKLNRSTTYSLGSLLQFWAPIAKMRKACWSPWAHLHIRIYIVTNEPVLKTTSLQFCIKVA